MDMNTSNQITTGDETKMDVGNMDSPDDQKVWMSIVCLSFTVLWCLKIWRVSRGVFTERNFGSCIKNRLDAEEIERLVEHNRITNNAEDDQFGKMRIGSF